MYRIYADDTLIYDSTLEDYKIGKGVGSLETNKSGSFVFSLYPDHFYYDSFVRLKTVITVYKRTKIVFRGRILNDVTDYWNNKVITCEGELGFLQDSIIRPFSFSGSPRALFEKFVNEHNAQVDEFKRFKIGSVTVVDPNTYIARSNSDYNSTFENLNSRLIEDSLGGYFYITHGEDGTDPTPTLNYLADFTKVSSQRVEFGSNLKNYIKTVNAEDIATAIIPLGAPVDDGNPDTEDKRLTIASVNNGVDYVYSSEAVKLRGWIFKTVTWDDVTIASNLKTKAEKYLQNIVNQNITIEVTIVDLHLIDPTIESFSVCDYIRVTSEPHNFDSTLLCNRQTFDILKPDNDTLTLGYSYSTFTELTNKVSSVVTSVGKVQNDIKNISNKIIIVEETANNASNTATDANNKATQAITTETDPTVPDWAKESSKPSYTAKEVGALPITGGTMTGAINMGSKKITALPTPTANTDAVNKAYVDQFVSEDYVVETGINGSWAYRIWKSGYAEMRGRFSITLNAGETSKATYVAFPFNMATAYAFAQTEQQAWRLSAPVDIGIETTQVKVSYFTTAQSTAVTYHFHLFVVGIKA